MGVAVNERVLVSVKVGVFDDMVSVTEKVYVTVFVYVGVAVMVIVGVKEYVAV